MTVEEVAEYYKNDLLKVEQEMERSLKSYKSPIYNVGMHLLQSGGKRIRPLLVITCARLAGYNGNGEDIVLANIIESIHTASLLHDDIVDSARLRRGRPAANAIWGNQIVILVGDFLYSNALRLATNLNNLKIIETLSMAISGMSRSELLQLQNARSIYVTEKDYLEIIEGKTALLLSAACKVGAIIGNVSEEKINAVSAFGLKLGLTFQLIDDVLDFNANEQKLGKRLGNDLKEGRITYPLIRLLETASESEIKQIQKTISSSDIDDQDMAYIVNLLKQRLSLEQSYEKARKLTEEAKNELMVFEDSLEKSSLLAIADYALTREN
jgi:octaprenyl-diphosphate synthase